MPELDNTVDEFPIRSLRLAVGKGEGGSTRKLLVSKVLAKRKGIKRLVKMDLATVCDGKRSIISTDYTKKLNNNFKQKGQQAIKADPLVRNHFSF